MEQDNPEEKYYSKQKVGNYEVANLLSQGEIFSTKSKKVELSFKIYDILLVDDSEIMKLEFPKIKNIIMRLMKYTNDSDQPALMFDIVNTESKQIVIESDKEYVGGLGVEHFLYSAKIITQWELPVASQLCRAFVLGDIEAIKLLMDRYYLKISDENVIKLKNSFGIK